MYISNGKDKVTYISNRPTKEDKEKYYNTCNLDLMLGELYETRGLDETIDFLKAKLKYYRALKKEMKKEDDE